MKCIFNKLILFALAISVSCVAYAPNTVGQNGTQTTGTTLSTVPGGSNSNKISNLQDVINQVSPGTTINLSLDDYSSITNYNATIDKSLTIIGGNDLKGNSLTINSSGVVLTNLANLSVTTTASTKISGSILNNLSVNNIASGSLQPTLVGRGEDDTTSAPPSVWLENTQVQDWVKINADNALLNVKNVETPKININGKKAQVSIKDKNTTIDTITTSQVCKVVLEDGTNDNVTNLDVTGDGELTHINMVGTNRKLLKLTVFGGLNSCINEDETPDFSNLIVMGIYEGGNNGVKKYRTGGLSYDSIESVTKLESNFTVLIDDTPYFQNGSIQAADKLSVDKHHGKITSPYSSKAVGYECEFDFTVIAKQEQTQTTAKPTLTLDSITADTTHARKLEYQAGEYLDLDGVIITGEYTLTVGTVSTNYTAVITDYTTSIDFSTPLRADDTTVVITCNGKTCPITIKVNESYTVTYIVDQNNDSLNKIVKQVKAGECAEDLKNFNRDGYDFKGWCPDKSLETPFNFSTAITHDTEIYAKWEKISYKIIYHNILPNTDTTRDETFDIEQEVALIDLTADDYRFLGWYYNANFDNIMLTDGWGAGTFNRDVDLYAKWEKTKFVITFMIGDTTIQTGSFHIDNSIDIHMNPASPTGYRFDGWYRNADCSGDKISGWNAGEVTSDISLYGKHIPITYKIQFHKNDGSGTTLEQFMTYDVTSELDCRFERLGYNFAGWATEPTSDTVVYHDKQAVRNLADTEDAVFCLYAVWDQSYGIDLTADTDLTIANYSDSSILNLKIEDNSFVGFKWYIEGVHIESKNDNNCLSFPFNSPESELGDLSGITFIPGTYIDITVRASKLDSPLTYSANIQILVPITGSNP